MAHRSISQLLRWLRVAYHTLPFCPVMYLLGFVFCLFRWWMIVPFSVWHKTNSQEEGNSSNCKERIATAPGHLKSPPISTHTNTVVPRWTKKDGLTSVTLLNSLIFQNRMDASRAVSLGVVPVSYEPCKCCHGAKPEAQALGTFLVIKWCRK